MAQDLRELFEKERKTERFAMKDGHEDRFFSRLQEELPVATKKTKNFQWKGIAASIVFLLGLGSYFLITNTKDAGAVKTTVVEKGDDEHPKAGIGLGDLSPELQKIETYYVTNINLALSKVEVSDDNKEIVDGYLERLEELNLEYQELNKELNEIGPNDQTIAAMVQNLQLRAQLLQKLNAKLNQLKSSKNEQESNII